ncbi:MAG: 50S ribosomal protein L32 [Candidatus Eisenbacteria bacterium]|uniref:Large ribosomal subunit protein bL32 n=1 Tax=Eiseniibacteriota bacterium TaxID=2212470 RepID=A0A956RQP0_UNCEI|nr:50S ribosomal protein L32 [Candidatus Eisenbacteria bacterium]
MALPKRRHSSARRDKRRANWKLGAPPASRCAHCGATKRPHHVCPECGYYRGEEVQVVNG